MFERAIDRAINTPAPTKLRYPAVLFSGCQDTEFSYDTSFNGRPNGAFTRVGDRRAPGREHLDAARAARRHPAKASRTVAAADSAAVRKPRSQTGPVVLMADATMPRIPGSPPFRSGRRCSISAATSTDPASRIRSSRRSTKSSRWAAARRCPPPFISTSSRARSASRLRHGEQAESEFLGAVNSGDPETLEQFLLWAFDACPARRYVLVMAGLGIMDSDSVVGRPPFDAARLFAICDDRATNDAIELHELSATLKAAFPPDGPRRLVLLACDMYAMQFMEVAYELRGVLDLMLGIQPDERAERLARSPTGPTRAACGAGRRSWRSPARRDAALAVGRGPAGTGAREGNGRPSRGALHEHAGQGLAGHGLGDRPGSARPGRAGARYLQRRLPPVAEQRRHLAGARKRREEPHEDARALVELRPR